MASLTPHLVQARTQTRRLLTAATVACCWAACPSRAAAPRPWPTWRGDSGRRGTTPISLPAELHRHWSRQLPAFSPAWPYEPRLQFDLCYEPVVARGRVFLASPVDGSVRSFDAHTGAEQWVSFTNGPVRFAPVFWRSKLYVGSDDGRVYCLDADSGTPEWVFRTAPQDRPDAYHLGNNRLISFWPVRGGPVIAGDTLYVGSGLWPVLGTFVYALNPMTGGVRWVNDRLNYMADIRVDHNRIADSSLCPQGYLVHADGKLFVPNGRAMPTGLDPATGALRHYVQGYRHGHCRVTASGDVAFVGPQAVLDSDTGRELGSRWREGDPETPREWSPRHDLFETPFVAYKFAKGCDAWSVVDGKTVYGAHEGVFYGYDLARARRTTYKKKAGGHEMEPAKWEPHTLWHLPTDYAKTKPLTRIMLKAGDRLYGHAGPVLLALQLSEEESPPELVWHHEIDGTPESMAAAEGRLFVSTREGKLFCFAEGQAEATEHGVNRSGLAVAEARWSQRAAAILAATGATEGICVVLGLSEGRLVTELLRQSALRVIGITPDSTCVDRLRTELVAAGLYGSRVELFAADPWEFRLPPYLANLMVSESETFAGVAARTAADRLYRSLRPYGGVLCLTVPAPRHTDFTDWTTKGELPSADIAVSNGMGLMRRVGALPGSDDWTHECASPGRTYYSSDQQVKLPLGVLWYGDGPDHGFKKHKDYHIGVKPQVCGGRLVAFNERAHLLRSYDIYTGRHLWERSVSPFARFASMPDGVFVAQGPHVTVLDPADGSEKANWPVTVEGAESLFAADIRVTAQTVVTAVDFEKVRNLTKGLYDSRVLVGLDRATGRQLWVVRATDRFSHHGLAAGNGRVFCSDSPSNATTGEMKRRGETPESLSSTVIALDARDGQSHWRRDLAYPFTSYGDEFWSLQSRDDSLAYSEEADVLLVRKDKRMWALNGTAGDLLWEKDMQGGQPLVVHAGTYYEQSGAAYDIRTGKPLPRHGGVRGGNGCNHAVACGDLFLRRTHTAACFNVVTGETLYMRNVRSGCTNSLIPAGGVVSSPCFSVGCVCNHPLETSFSLVHMPSVAGWGGSEGVREPLPLGERDPAKLRVQTAPGPEDVVLLPAGSAWRYFDRGRGPGESWRLASFEDESWGTGRAQLGYGDNDEQTKVSFGDDPKNKHRTTYFRAAFNLPDSLSLTGLVLRVLRDDGVVVYLNGTEIHRDNMPEGNVLHDTAAPRAVFGDEESTWQQTAVPADFLTAGRNVLAVEVHQVNPASSDISFDLELRGQVKD